MTLLPARVLVVAAIAAVLTACGGGNPLGNAPTLMNPPTESGQKLSFVYFQKCINPVLLKPLPIDQGGQQSVNTCAGSGCHDDQNGTGGSFRVVAQAQAVDLATADADAARTTGMYRNFYSAQGAAVIGSPAQSRLLDKPLLRGVLHGGGLVFDSDQHADARLIAYWISRPVPEGQDEFSASANAMFTPPDAASGECNTQ